MDIFFFPIIFFIFAILFIFLWKLGPWGYRKRVLSYPTPEGWITALANNIPEYHKVSQSSQKDIEDILKVLMAEKSFITNPESLTFSHEQKLFVLSIGAWIGAYASKNYFDDFESIEVGELSSNHSFSIQVDERGLFSSKWYQPKLLEELDLNEFSYPFRGLVSEWASYLNYNHNLFKKSLAPIDFDLSLFPLFMEVYLSDKELLQKQHKDLYRFFNDHYSI